MEERASMFNDALEFEALSKFKPKPKAQQNNAPKQVEEMRAVAEEAGFRSREPKPAKKKEGG